MKIKDLINRNHDIDFMLKSMRKCGNTIESCITIEQLDTAERMTSNCLIMIYIKEHFYEYTSFVNLIMKITNKKMYDYHTNVIEKTLEYFVLLFKLIDDKKKNLMYEQE